MHFKHVHFFNVIKIREIVQTMEWLVSDKQKFEDLHLLKLRLT